MSIANDIRNERQKDPKTLEREIDATRVQMGRTLDALERKLSPGQLLDHYLGIVGEHGGEFAANFGNSIKQNPVAMMLTAIGLTSLMFSPNRKVEDNRSKITEDLSRAGESIKAAGERARNQVTNSKDAMAETLSDTASSTQAQARRAREGFNFLLEEQPLLLGALGIAVGAAIGAALPRTEQEDRVMGRGRDKTIGQAKQRSAEVYERVRESVR